jgi:hypothetical protein
VPKQTAKPVTIYALVDPRDGVVRYVGQTVDVKTRAREHRHPGGGGPYMHRWKRELDSLGLTPRFVVLASAPRRGREADELEATFIRMHSATSFNWKHGDHGRLRHLYLTGL